MPLKVGLEQTLEWAAWPPLWAAQPSLHHLASRFVHGQVYDPYNLFSHVLLSVSNQIENHLIKQLKT
jgi:hypothetical protein